MIKKLKKTSNQKDLEYQTELSEAEKLQGQFNLPPIPEPSELEHQTEVLLGEALEQIK